METKGVIFHLLSLLSVILHEYSAREFHEAPMPGIKMIGAVLGSIVGVGVYSGVGEEVGVGEIVTVGVAVGVGVIVTGPGVGVSGMKPGSSLVASPICHFPSVLIPV